VNCESAASILNNYFTPSSLSHFTPCGGPYGVFEVPRGPLRVFERPRSLRLRRAAGAATPEICWNTNTPFVVKLTTSRQLILFARLFFNTSLCSSIGADESYPISRTLIEDGRNNLILRGGTDSLPLTCPVRLIHSQSDEEVPYETAIKVSERSES